MTNPSEMEKLFRVTGEYSVVAEEVDQIHRECITETVNQAIDQGMVEIDSAIGYLDSEERYLVRKALATAVQNATEYTIAHVIILETNRSIMGERAPGILAREALDQSRVEQSAILQTLWEQV